MTTRTIGRERELDALEAFLDRPPAGARALVLSGEAGIGKSTLWHLGVEAAIARSWRVLASRPAESERLFANVVLTDLFGEITAGELDALPAPQRSAFEASVLLREPAQHTTDPRMLGTAILTLLRSLFEAGPRVLIAIDDDQWMDAASRETLQFALRRLRDRPWRLLLSRRAEVTTPGLDIAAEPDAVERLEVAPMSLGGIQLLLRSQVDASLGRSTLVRLHEQSGGNPFFALELASAQAEKPSIGGPGVPFLVPPTLERLVEARLRSLDSATREALLLVAANGRLALAIHRRLDIEPAVVERALRDGLLERDGAAVRFSHPLVASTLYQAATTDDRAAAHRRLAELTDDVVQRARHRALAADVPSEAVSAGLDAAMAVARSRAMPAAAAELGEHAMRLTPHAATADLARRALTTSEAHFEAGDRARAREIATDVLNAAETSPTRARALLLLAELEQPTLGLTLLEDALAAATGMPELEAVAHGKLAVFGRFVQGAAFAQEHGRAMLELAERLGDGRLRATALSTLALLEFDQADPVAMEHAEAALLEARSLDDPRTLGEAALAVSHLLAWSGDTRRARPWLVDQLRAWQDRDEHVRVELVWYLGFVELQRGDWDRAAEHDVDARDSTADSSPADPGNHFCAALLALHRGDIDGARNHAETALARPDSEFMEDFIAVLATCDLWRGDPAAAVGQFARAEDIAEKRGQNDPNSRYWRAEYVEALLLVGRIEAAADLATRWEAVAAQLGRERTLAQVARCRGLIDAARGDLGGAAERLARAVALHDEAEDPFGAARALLALGGVRRRSRQKRSARVTLEAARDRFAALGAAAWAATATLELGRIGGRHHIAGLSPSEERVAALVAEGLTNREIAAALFLGQRTVASHLTHIYAKLGIRSRTELARRGPTGWSESAQGVGKAPTN